MKRLFFVMFALTLLLAGCQSKENAENVPSDTSKQQSQESSTTIYSLKQKYGAESTSSIMPMYNVEQDQEFLFNFKADLSSSHLSATDMISVHTDIKALQSSKVQAIVKQSGNSVLVKPLGWGVLASESMRRQDQSSWGGAPVYYLRINYDLNSENMSLLPEPMVIPFTVKSELSVPNVRYEIDKDKRFKLVWDKVEGATEYKIYNRAVLNFDNMNIPLSGAEDGFTGNMPLSIATTTETSFDDFMKDGKGALGVINDTMTSIQNNNLKGEYYVTAVNGTKESNFSNGIATAPLSVQLPMSMSSGISLSKYGNTAQLPQQTLLEHIDGSLSYYPVVYDTADVTIAEFSTTDIPFHVKGTALKSYVRVDSVTPEDLDKLNSAPTAESNTGFVEPKNDTPYVPAPDVPTIIGEDESTAPAQDNTNVDNSPVSEENTESNTEPDTDTDTDTDTDSNTTTNEEQTSEPGATSQENSQDTPNAESTHEDNVVDAQKSNTEQQVEQGDQESVPEPDTDDAMINADSALEEVLARNMIAAEENISLKAFPEAQNFETLSDVILKVVHQNPLILDVDSFEYSYGTLTLTIHYSESADAIHQKQKEIIAKSKEVVASIIKDGMDDDAKRKAIYDYLNDNAKYDMAALENAEKNNFQTVDAEFNDSFNTYGILVKGIGVCASYASVYKLLSDLADLESIVVTGTSSGVPHAWNKVKIGDEWFHVDATNNETNSGIPYFLYNANDATAADQGSVVDKEYWLDSELSMFNGDSDANDYYVQNDLQVDSLSAYKTKTESELKNGEKRIVLRFASPVDSDQVMEAAGEAIAAVDEALLETATLATLGSYVVLEP